VLNLLLLEVQKGAAVLAFHILLLPLLLLVPLREPLLALPLLVEQQGGGQRWLLGGGVRTRKPVTGSSFSE
jgi:hypothetical protein